jgi:hypothetical protein
MKRVSGLVSGFMFLLGTGTVVAACAHDDSTFIVRGVLAPPIAQTGAVCTYTADANNLYLSSGTLDSAFLLDYSPVFLVGNQAKPQGDPDQVRTETSRITVQGAIVRITDAGGNEIKSYTRLTSAFIDPAQASTPSYADVNVTIVDADTVKPIRDAIAVDAQGSPALGVISAFHRRLVSYVRFFGQTLGGQHVESDEFEYPVDICYGCLVFSTTAGCSPAGTSSSQQVNMPCILGQDQGIDCRLCHGYGPCP